MYINNMVLISKTEELFSKAWYNVQLTCQLMSQKKDIH